MANRCGAVQESWVLDRWTFLHCDDDQWHTGFDLTGIPNEVEHHCVKDGVNYKWRA